MLHVPNVLYFNKAQKWIIYFFLLLYPFHGFCQNVQPTEYPSAVLVQLFAGQSRIIALKKANRQDLLALFQHDIEKVMTSTANDFKENFIFCPFYFYIDTNFKKIMDKNFDGVLLNSDLSTATNANIKDSSYLIVYYGEPTWQTKRWRWDTTEANQWGGKPNGRGLVINDYKFRQIGYLYRLNFDIFNIQQRRRRNKYLYFSKKFDLEYFPFAYEFNAKLSSPKTKRQIRKYRQSVKH